MDASNRPGSRNAVKQNNFLGSNIKTDETKLVSAKASPSPKAITSQRNITPVPYSGAKNNQAMATPDMKGKHQSVFKPQNIDRMQLLNDLEGDETTAKPKPVNIAQPK
jgi:hypothetical protein